MRQSFIIMFEEPPILRQRLLLSLEHIGIDSIEKQRTNYIPLAISTRYIEDSTIAKRANLPRIDIELQGDSRTINMIILQ